ncbi:MAG: YbaB/EbfC family nucleoid-associated protein [Acidimicrobiia bacterium]|nr:YbaB/EbfC family nucleoid-associated protein [Acidimicrobiia bacterium]
MPDLGSLLDAAQQMGEQLAASQAAAAETILEGQSGGGAVKISVTGGLEFQSVTIAPGAVDPDDVEMLEDLVLAALNDAMSKLSDSQSGGLDLGGLDLGGLDLGGLLGGSE